MTAAPDRLLHLLPQVIQDSDALTGRALQALLRVLGGQLGVVEDDVVGLLENWFVETCDEWALPYLGELVGVRPVPSNAPPGTDDAPRSRLHARAAYPRREFARAVEHRRRKGTLLVLQELARDSAGWPARAVEFRHLMRAAWSARDGGRPPRGPAAREESVFERGFGPFDGLPRRPDFRGLGTGRRRGSVVAVGLWVWRLKSHQVKAGRARPMKHDGPEFDRFWVNPFGVDLPLFVWPRPLPDPTEPAAEPEVPGPLRRTALAADLRAAADVYYGPDASLYFWRGDKPPCAAHGQAQPAPALHAVPPSDVRVADLEHWERLDGPHWPKGVKVVVDPRSGRAMVRREHHREQVLAVRYHAARPADMGGGGYFREPLDGPPGAVLKRVAAAGPRPAPPHDRESLQAALDDWGVAPRPRNWVIEIDDDHTHELSPACADPVKTRLGAGESLVIRAAAGRRPVVRHAHSGARGARWSVMGDGAAGFSLDGVAVVDFPLRVGGSIGQVRVRHCTLFGGRALRLHHLDGCVSVEYSIVAGGVRSARPGGIQHPPPRVLLSDSILTAAVPHRPRCEGAVPTAVRTAALSGYADLTARRCTVFGPVSVSAIDLAEDCIFAGPLSATNTARGCVRYSALKPDPDDTPRTPPRYACQTAVAPRFRSRRFGDAEFAQLADSCPPAIRRGGTGGSEMGAFHDQFTPVREALLAARLEEFTPAGADVRLLFAT